MLKGISPVISPELLKIMAEMGHGDELILADAHFPGHTFCKKVIRADGLSIPALLEGILPLLELDSYADPLIMMAAVEGDKLDPSVEKSYMTAIKKSVPDAPAVMRAVCWENIRNYHWEYYRQMEDCRNDTASHVLVKNPYLHPIGYQDAPESLAVGEWHRLQFVHEGNRLRGAINGVQMLDVVDDPFSGFGPVMRNGTLAIRCMWGSDILFRNLKVWTKPDAF